MPYAREGRSANRAVLCRDKEGPNVMMKTELVVLSALWAITSGLTAYSVWRRKRLNRTHKVGWMLVCFLPLIGPVSCILCDFDERGPHGRDGEFREREVE